MEPSKKVDEAASPQNAEVTTATDNNNTFDGYGGGGDDSSNNPRIKTLPSQTEEDPARVGGTLPSRLEEDPTRVGEAIPSHSKKDPFHESGKLPSCSVEHSSVSGQTEAGNFPIDGKKTVKETNSTAVASAPKGTPQVSKKRKHKKYLEEDDECDKMVGRTVGIPQPTDILLGRGKGVSETPGNIRFLRLIESHVEPYLATHRQSRGKYCGTIVRQAQRSYGARFLEPSDSPEGPWKIADSEKARKKVGQAIRYRLRQIAEDERAKRLDGITIIPKTWANVKESSSKHTENKGNTGLVDCYGQTEETESQDEEECKENDISEDSSMDEYRKVYKKQNKWTKALVTQKKINELAPSVCVSSNPIIGATIKPRLLPNQKRSLDSPESGRSPKTCNISQESSHGSCYNSTNSDQEFGQVERLHGRHQHGTESPASNKRQKQNVRQASLYNASSDQLTMDDCLQILSSFGSNPDDVNQALRRLRKLVVEGACVSQASPTQQITNVNLSWNFVCLHRGFPLVCHCMANFASHAGIQSNACFLLSELLRLSQHAQQNKTQQQPELSMSSFALIMQAAGVIEAVLKAMGDHPRDRLVNNNALAMLSTFTKELKSPQKELERVLVCQCIMSHVLTALQAFGTDAKIARHTGNILWNLSMDQACRKIMVGMGAATAVSLAILQVTQDFKALYTTLHLRILQDFYYSSTIQDESDSRKDLFHLDAIQANASPFPRH